MARYITTLQRAGASQHLTLPPLGEQLNDSLPGILSAQHTTTTTAATPPTEYAAGLHYCHGLLALGAGDLSAAEVCFTTAMQDEAWRVQAAEQMLQMLLQPTIQGIWEMGMAGGSASSSLKNATTGPHSSSAAGAHGGLDASVAQHAQHIAQQLAQCSAVQGAVWQAYLQLCTALSSTTAAGSNTAVSVNKTAEAVLSSLLGLLFDNQQDPSVLLATATTHLVLGQLQQVCLGGG